MNSPPDILTFLKLFRGREDYFAQQGEDSYYPVPCELDEFYIGRHLDGDMTCGLYLLTNDSRCHLICIDIDIPKGELDQVDFGDPKHKYAYLKKQLDAVLEALCLQFGVPSNSILMEETGGRGYHIWVFFDGPVKGEVAVAFGMKLKAYLGFDIEFFPKQGFLTQKRKFGNLIKLPLGIHRKYGSRSSFLVVESQGPRNIVGTSENLTHLKSVVPMSIEKLTAFESDIPTELPSHKEDVASMSKSNQRRPRFCGNPSFLLARCTAMSNLRAKAEDAVRFSHSEAFFFADVMLSVQGGTKIVHDTMRLSLANDYDRIRTQSEIDRIAPLYPPSCLTLVQKGVCPDYCKESVRKANEDPLVPDTTPCSVWLRRESTKCIVEPDNLIERIGDPENVMRSFLQLKQYHEHEDSLFFDPFDFEQFEGRLDANCEFLARSLREQREPDFLGYMPVDLPKKINAAQELEYRRMSYSTVYDQTPIQAIFNGVAPILENKFQSTSYGYRWNTDLASPYRIFENWRDAYPRFRNDIMAALEQHPSGFHICCDIKGFYDHVDHDILLEQLRKLVSDPYVFKMIERTVGAYTFSNNGVCGLPQGPAYARLLANLYLNDFDIHASQVATAYFRYVDDFVLVFETEHDAEEGLEHIVRFLANLGLELSQEEAKRAVISANTDISRVQKTLDKIHYGILEGTRHVEHFAPQEAADFMDAVQRHRVSPVNLEELLQINDAIPSLLYVTAQETLFPNQLKPKILNIVEFLVQKGWFFPKRLKNIFYRLIDLESDVERLHRLFKAMESSHKVYFLLSVFGAWQSRGEHQVLLKKLVQTGTQDDSAYVLGFAIAIAAKLEIDINYIIDRQVMMERFFVADGRFALMKWLSAIDYLAESDDERATIRGVIDPRSPSLLRILLLSNVTKLPSVYTDDVYLSGLLKDCGVLVLPVACDLLVEATDKGEVFDALIELMGECLAFKSLAISIVSKRIFDKHASSGLAEIENLKSLYALIPDEELKQCMLGSLSRIVQYGLACDVDFAKQHKEIARYDECYLFEMLEKEGRYDYLELIPAKSMRDNTSGDLDFFSENVDDLSTKGILPHSTVFYDSGKDEFRIEYKAGEKYRVLDPDAFSMADESVCRACALAAQIYRKACYFRRRTGRAPQIIPENLLVDVVSGSVVFRSIGRSLNGLHVINGMVVGDEDADIAKMLATLLETLVFKSQDECIEFSNKKPHTGIRAFLCQFIQRLKSKDPDRRYSYQRFAYLVDQLSNRGDSPATPNSLEVLYLRERLKGGLFCYNSSAVTWQGISRSLDDHLSHHLRAVCSAEALHNYPYRSRLFLSGKGTRQLHVISRQLWDLALCRKDFPDAEASSPAYLDLLEFLLLYASICLEVISLARIYRKTDVLRKLTSSVILSGERVRFKAANYEAVILTKDIAALVIRQPKQKNDVSTDGLSLQQLSLLALLGCGAELEHDTITIERPDKLRDEVFRSFAHACLVRIPKIEQDVKDEIEEIFLNLRSNEDFGRLEHLEEMRNAVSILTQDMRRVRSCLGLSRRSGRADGKYFPPEVRCKSLFRRILHVKESSLPGCALTNSFPSSRAGYKCSWDIVDDKAKNLVIPSEGLHSLIQDLTRGKLFGFKLSNIYSGRAMALWDIPAMIVFATVRAICEHVKECPTSSNGMKSFCSVMVLLLGALLITLIGKVLLHDLGHWFPRFRKKITNFLYRVIGKDKST